LLPMMMLHRLLRSVYNTIIIKCCETFFLRLTGSQAFFAF
jgi:hypothetical protein